VVNGADLVCFVGHRDRRHDHAFWAVPKIGTPAIQIDIDPQAIARNYPLLAGVNGDAKVALAMMLAAADRGSAAKRKSWTEEAQKMCRDWAAKYQSALTSNAAPIRPERICAELTRHVPDNAIVVVDTGHAGMWMGGMYDLTSPRQSYLRSAGHLGWAFSRRSRRESAHAPTGRWSPSQAMPGFGTTSPKSRRRRAGASMPSPCQQPMPAATMSKRGFDRVMAAPSRAGARALDLQQGQFRTHREDMGALGMRIEKPGDIARLSRRRSRPTARS